MRRAAARALALLALLGATATCTQLLGVDEPSLYDSDGGGPGALPSCAAGRASCRGAICDTDLTSDLAHCGACGVRCATLNGTATCSAGKCVVACAAGLAECNGDLLDGCETDLRSSSTSCGACGHDCGGAPCSAGVCDPLLIGATQQLVNHLEADDERVYVAEQSQIEVFPSQGGSSQTLPVTGTAAQLRLQGGTLYVARTVNVPPTLKTEIDGVSRNGMNIDCLTRAPLPAIRQLALSQNAALWGVGVSDTDAGAPLLRGVAFDASCAPDAQAPGPAVASVARTTSGKSVESMVVEGTVAYVTLLDRPGASIGDVARIDLASGAEVTLTPRRRPPVDLSRALVIDDAYVYFTHADIFVQRIAKTGCTATCPTQDVYSEDLGRILAINTDATNVYILATDGTTAYLEIVAKADFSKRRRFPSDQNAVSGDIAINSGFVFYSLGQKVYRVAR